MPLRFRLCRRLLPSLGGWLLSCIFFVSVLEAQPEWRRARSTNFELITSANPALSERTLLWLETFRHAAKARLNLPANRLVPTTVYLFPNDARYGSYKPVVNGQPSSRSGHAVRAPDRLLLALHGNVDDDLFQTQLFHLYAHELIREAGFTPPPWLEEGMAAAMGGFKVQGDQYWFNRYHADDLPLQGVQVPEGYRHISFVEEYRTMHGDFTRLRRLVDFDRIIGEGEAAPDLHHVEDPNYFCLQSWLLAHFCLFGEERQLYGPRLLLFASLDLDETPARQVSRFERTLGIKGRKLRRALERYYEAGRWTDLKGPIPARLLEWQQNVSFAPVTDAEAALALAGLSALSRPDQPLPDRLAGERADLAEIEWLAARAHLRADVEAEDTLARKAVTAGTLRGYYFTYLGEQELLPYLGGLTRSGVLEQSRADRLRDRFERALAMDPGDPSALAGLAWTEALAIEIENANVNRVQDALGRLNRPYHTLVAVAAIRWRIGDDGGAQQLLQQLRSYPDPEVQRRVGLVERAMGR